MKKIFMALSLMAMMTLGACSNKSNDETTDSDSIEMAPLAEDTTVAEMTPMEQPGGDASSSSIEEYVKSNNYTISDSGDIVDSTGAVILTFNQAKDKWPEAYKVVMESYGKNFQNALNAVQGTVEAAAGMTTEEIKDKANEVKDQAIDKANEIKDKAVDKATEKVKEVQDKAKEKAEEIKDKAKDKADKLLNDALDKINN